MHFFQFAHACVTHLVIVGIKIKVPLRFSLITKGFLTDVMTTFELCRRISRNFLGVQLVGSWKCSDCGFVEVRRSLKPERSPHVYSVHLSSDV